MRREHLETTLKPVLCCAVLLGSLRVLASRPARRPTYSASRRRRRRRRAVSRGRTRHVITVYSGPAEWAFFGSVGRVGSPLTSAHSHRWIIGLVSSGNNSPWERRDDGLCGLAFWSVMLSGPYLVTWYTEYGFFNLYLYNHCIKNTELAYFLD